MERKININEKFFVAGGNGMVGSAIIRKLKKVDMVKSQVIQFCSPQKKN